MLACRRDDVSYKVILAFVSVFALTLSSLAIDPLTVATTGVATSVLLDKMEDKANTIVGNAGSVGSLLTTKAARDIELEITAARQQLHEELNQNWDRLDNEKVS